MSSLVLSGDTSGSITLSAPAVSGTTTITLPTVSGGNFVVSDSSGNVGIGTSSPSAKLHVRTSSTGSTAYGILLDAGAQQHSWYLSDNTTSAFFIGSTAGQFTWSNSNGERMRIDSSGNVGIGTTLSGTPILNASLNVYGAGFTEGSFKAIQVLVNNSTAYNASPTAGIDFGFKYKSDGTLGTAAGIYGAKENATDNNYASYLGFATAVNGGSVTERMRIDSSGNVLVGKTSTALTSNGWTFTPNTGSNYCFDMAGLTNECFNYNNTGTGTYDIAFRYQATVKGYIRVNSTNTTYSTTSDYRLKENVQPMVGALDKVAQLKPVTYTWKVDGKDGQGFIAHELQAVVPDAVVGEKDAVDEEGNPKYQGIDTSFLVATLTAAIQEQTQIINDLKARIETLESK